MSPSRLTPLSPAAGRGPAAECWIPPSLILECRALLETYHDLRAEHTAWVQRIHAVFFHQGAPALGEAALRTDRALQALRAAAACHLSPAGQLQVATALGMHAEHHRRVLSRHPGLPHRMAPDRCEPVGCQKSA